MCCIERRWSKYSQVITGKVRPAYSDLILVVLDLTKYPFQMWRGEFLVHYIWYIIYIGRYCSDKCGAKYSTLQERKNTLVINVTSSTILEALINVYFEKLCGHYL